MSDKNKVRQWSIVRILPPPPPAPPSTLKESHPEITLLIIWLIVIGWIAFSVWVWLN